MMHVVAVLLLGATIVALGLGNFFAWVKVRDYKQALYVREEISAQGEESYVAIAPGGTMVITTDQAPRRIRIHSRNWAALRVSFE